MKKAFCEDSLQKMTKESSPLRWVTGIFLRKFLRIWAGCKAFGSTSDIHLWPVSHLPEAQCQVQPQRKIKGDSMSYSVQISSSISSPIIIGLTFSQLEMLVCGHLRGLMSPLEWTHGANQRRHSSEDTSRSFSTVYQYYDQHYDESR